MTTGRAGVPAPPRRVGVLVMAHGTPSAPEELEAFYTRIRRGSPPPAALLDELRSRYEAIGGVSPLAEVTAAQVAGLAGALESDDPGRFVVRFGAKHTSPFIEDAANDLAREGPAAVVGLVLAPHRASRGSDEYVARAEAALAAADGPGLVAVRQWYDAPGFAELLAGRVHDALARLPKGPGTPTVVFTAHSIPTAAVDAGDPYPDQVRESAAAVAAAADLGEEGVGWEVAWQSAGRTPEPWIGPDLLDRLLAIGAARTGRGVVVCPIGFVADHLEVLYDVDVEARHVAETAGVPLVRTESLNDDPRFVAILAGVVERAAAGSREAQTGAPGVPGGPLAATREAAGG